MPRWWVLCAMLLVCPPASRAADLPDLPHSVWLEAETFGPLKGGNFSYQPPDKTTKGSWSVSGPGVAPEWTQGGESEWMSIAARADEPGEVVAGRSAVIPADGTYTLWVRYADYRNKKESFGVRVKQEGRKDKPFAHVFGDKPVVDELDPMKLLWDWAFGWDHAEVELKKGDARIELYTTGPAEARRQVDCLCLTTDSAYHPAGREKPDCAAWLRPARDASGPADARRRAAGGARRFVRRAGRLEDRRRAAGVPLEHRPAVAGRIEVRQSRTGSTSPSVSTRRC